jgi:hypothetical protein
MRERYTPLVPSTGLFGTFGVLHTLTVFIEPDLTERALAPDASSLTPDQPQPIQR